MVETPVQHLGIPGLCMGCDGAGVKEGDKAELAARRAEDRRLARCSRVEGLLYQGTANHKLTREESYQAWAAYNGLLLLKADEPERYAKAIEAHYAGDPRLTAALADYYLANTDNPPTINAH